MFRWSITGMQTWQSAAILTSWHSDILAAAALIVHMGRANEVYAPIVREYGTSTSMTAFVKTLGMNATFIPPYEQAEARREALLALIPLLREGYSLFFAADGHRAPARVPRDEPPWLAAEANVPLLPFACHVSPAMRLPTWDKKWLPLPGSRISVAVAEPLIGNSPGADVAHHLESAYHQAKSQ